MEDDGVGLSTLILTGSRALEKDLLFPSGFGESSLHFLAGLFSFYDLKYDYD